VTAVLQTSGLGKQYGRRWALRDCTLSIPAGKVVGLVGPNGAGKTTLIKILTTLLAPTSGTATVNGHPLGETTQQIRAISGILTESPGLHEKLTARQNLAYYGRLYGLRGSTLRDAVNRYLGVVEMTEHADRRVGGFSKGMRQKVAIARALVMDPRILIFDEATSALDYASERVIQANMQQIADGRTVFIIAHRLSTVRHTHRILTIERGRLVEDGTHDELVCTGGRYAMLHRLQAGIQEIAD